MKLLFSGGVGGLPVSESSWGSSSRVYVARSRRTEAGLDRARTSVRRNSRHQPRGASKAARGRRSDGVTAPAHRSVFPQTAQRPSCPASLPTLPN